MGFFKRLVNTAIKLPKEELNATSNQTAPVKGDRKSSFKEESVETSKPAMQSVPLEESSPSMTSEDIKDETAKTVSQQTSDTNSRPLKEIKEKADMNTTKELPLFELKGNVLIGNSNVNDKNFRDPFLYLRDLPIAPEKIEEIDLSKCHNLTKLAREPFMYLKGIRKIILPESLESIWKSALSGCEMLKTIVFPKSLRNIEIYAFESCKSLQFLYLPDSVENVGRGAFFKSNLSYVVMPRSLKSSDNWIGAFHIDMSKCENIKSIPGNCAGRDCKVIYLPPMIKEIGKDAINVSQTVVYAPATIRSFDRILAKTVICYSGKFEIMEISASSRIKVLPEFYERLKAKYGNNVEVMDLCDQFMYEK